MEGYGKIRMLSLDQAPPKAEGTVRCSALIPAEVLVAALGEADGCTCGGKRCSTGHAQCSRPPHDPSEVHVSHGYDNATVWGGE